MSSLSVLNRYPAIYEFLSVAEKNGSFSTQSALSVLNRYPAIYEFLSVAEKNGSFSSQSALSVLNRYPAIIIRNFVCRGEKW